MSRNDTPTLGLVAAGAGIGLWWLLRQPSPHFTWAELTTTSTGLDNTPSLEDRIRLIYLARRVLEPLRAAVGPLITSSSYRSEILNQAVNGSPTSYHRLGLGWDGYSTEGYDNAELAAYLYGREDLPLAEVIVEEHTGHLHIAADIDGAPGERKFLAYDGSNYRNWSPANV
jgi:hypothetical protein